MKLQLINILRTLAIFLWQVFLFTSCEKEPNVVTKQESKRAVFVYMIADNDLDFYATANINRNGNFYGSESRSRLGVCIYRPC